MNLLRKIFPRPGVEPGYLPCERPKPLDYRNLNNTRILCNNQYLSNVSNINSLTSNLITVYTLSLTMRNFLYISIIARNIAIIIFKINSFK